MDLFRSFLFATTLTCSATAQETNSGSTLPVPDSLHLDQIPPIPSTLSDALKPYLNIRSARFQDWHPTRKELLITTRFGETSQAHRVTQPGGARRQLTFFAEPVRNASFHPTSGDFFLFTKDTGGNEAYQIYRFDLNTGTTTLLTDGQSRHGSGPWTKNGSLIAYTSTQRTGKLSDIYVMNPASPDSARLLFEAPTVGWFPMEWSPDGKQLIVLKYVSINESEIHTIDLDSGQAKRLLPRADSRTDEKSSFSGAAFDKKGDWLFHTSDAGSEFRQLCRYDLKNGQSEVLTPHIHWDVRDFQVSPDGTRIALIANEDGSGVLHLLDANTGKPLPAPKLPLGSISNLLWHNNGIDLGFNLDSARSPYDVYSVNVESGELARWTTSETGGLVVEKLPQPEIVRMKSFDGVEISAIIYRPDSQRFPGRRPALVSVHGGPESQSSVRFQSRYNYYLNELGLTLIYPNVRGSAGYGKTFLKLDNGFKREDSVKDIGTILDWLDRDERTDSQRIAIMGGSYGGYMVLASMVHFNDRIRCGIDRVGISNFVTFLKNTKDYRRDLRRAEYGDERDPKMRAFLEEISPANHADALKKPLLIVQGKNDPRVPETESAQMVNAIRSYEGKVWYLMAEDEGHGFRKKKNSDFEFLTTIQFLKKFLLEENGPGTSSSK